MIERYRNNGMNEAPVRARDEIVARELVYCTPNACYVLLDLPFIRRRKAAQSKDQVPQLKAFADGWRLTGA